MTTTITAIIREANGKGGARKHRRSGLVPGIMYGALEKPVPLAVKEKDLLKLLKLEGESGLLDLVFENDQGETVSAEKAIIREIDYDPEKDTPIHIDFMVVAMDRKLTISVPIELEGEPVGVTLNKGIMNQVAYELEIECLPSAIPHSIKIDVSGLDVGYSVHVRDLPVIEDYRILTGEEQTIVTIEAPKVEVVEEAEAAEAAEPELVGKGEATQEEKESAE